MDEDILGIQKNMTTFDKDQMTQFCHEAIYRMGTFFHHIEEVHPTIINTVNITTITNLIFTELLSRIPEDVFLPAPSGKEGTKEIVTGALSFLELFIADIEKSNPEYQHLDTIVPMFEGVFEVLLKRIPEEPVKAQVDESAEIEKVTKIIEECFVGTLECLTITEEEDFDSPVRYKMFEATMVAGADVALVRTQYQTYIKRIVLEVDPDFINKIFINFGE